MSPVSQLQGVVFPVMLPLVPVVIVLGDILVSRYLLDGFSI